MHTALSKGFLTVKETFVRLIGLGTLSIRLLVVAPALTGIGEERDCFA